MATLEELTRRLAAVERQLAQEAGLRASQDRDLADLSSRVRAMSGLLRALAATQSEHTATIAALIEQVDGLGDEVRRLRIEHGAKLDHIVTLLTTLIERDS